MRRTAEFASHSARSPLDDATPAARRRHRRLLYLARRCHRALYVDFDVKKALRYWRLLQKEFDREKTLFD